MKNWIVFLLGLISGIVLTFVVMMLLAMRSDTSKNGMTFFDEPGKCLSTKSFEVIQVVDNNYALAHEVEWSTALETYVSKGLLVLITNDDGEYYYDNQVIEIPKGMYMRQVGIYEYRTKMEINKTVPIVKLMKK